MKTRFAVIAVVMLMAQVLLGDGAYAVRVPVLPWERGVARADEVAE